MINTSYYVWYMYKIEQFQSTYLGRYKWSNLIFHYGTSQSWTGCADCRLDYFYLSFYGCIQLYISYMFTY